MASDLRDVRSGAGPLLVALALTAVLVGALAVFGSVTETPRTTEPAPTVLAPFGTPLDAALAYLGTDRVVYLLDLATGEQLGSKSIANDRRPAAASSTHLYLGRLSAAPGVDNWDHWRALPWQGTQYRDLGPGNWLAFSPQLDAVVAAGHPLPAGESGVRILGAGARILTSSAGLWGAITPAGDRVLARRLAGSDTEWWVLGGAAPGRIPLPERFRPIAGGPGVVAGRVGDLGLFADLDTGATVVMNGPLSAAAAWDPEGTLLATVGADPPALCTHRRDGAALWCRVLLEPASPERSGVSWAPDGSFVVVAEGGTLSAYRADGEWIGPLDGLHPTPQVAAAWIQVLARPRPDGTISG